MNHTPAIVANNPKIMLPAKYRKNVINRSACNRPYPSRANAEKVVKPPQKPVINNNLISGDRKAYLEERPYKKPISRHPEMFARKVPAGKL